MKVLSLAQRRGLSSWYGRDSDGHVVLIRYQKRELIIERSIHPAIHPDSVKGWRQQLFVRFPDTFDAHVIDYEIVRQLATIAGLELPEGFVPGDL